MAEGLKFLGSISKWLYNKLKQKENGKRIHTYLKENTNDKAGERFKTTLEIASHTNLPEATVKEICSTHKAIFQSIEDREKWSIYSREEKSIYEERGILNL